VATGRAADAAEVRAVAESAGIPTLVGSGITADNVAQYPAADAYIVGSWLKGGGLWTSPPDPARCDALRAAVETLPGQ
jgi:predicted TIM-barrel enzyme